MKRLKKFHLNIKLISLVGLFILGEGSYNLLHSQNYHEGARQGAMGGAGVAIVDVWALYYNQAALAFMETPAIGFFYENKYMTNVGFQALGIVVPTNGGAWGFNFSFMGLRYYNQMKTSLAYALKLNPDFSVSAQLDYLHLGYPSSYYYNGMNALVAEVGFFKKFSDYLSVGGHIFNPYTILSNAGEQALVETTMSFGFRYVVTERIATVVAIEKDIRYNPVFQAGLEYFYRDRLYFRGGFSSNPSSFSFGIGYCFSGFKVNIAFYTHPILGTTPQMDINYYFGDAVAKQD